MDQDIRSSSSRERVRKHRSRRKIEAQMTEELSFFRAAVPITSDTSENADVHESVVILGNSDGQDITQYSLETDDPGGSDFAIDIDMNQEKVRDLQHADAHFGSDVSADNSVHQETTRDTQEEHVDIQNFQDTAEHENDFIEPVIETNVGVVQELRHWAIESNIQQNHLDKLLAILRKNLIPSLPKSSKTFLETSSVALYCITEMEDASILNTPRRFAYFGIERGLQRCINNGIHDGIIELIFNVDGLPISNSSGKCFWPILCKPHYIPDIYSPFPVAIYLGMSKPKNLDNYLRQFIEEINDLQKNGVIVCGRNYEVRLKCFVADTPARAYLKCCKCHGGYNACERCVVHRRSESTGRGSTVVYLGVNHEQRTLGQETAKTGN